MGAMRTSCMITFILAGAAFLTAAMGFTGIPRRWRPGSPRMGCQPVQLIAVLTLSIHRPRLFPRRHLDGRAHRRRSSCRSVEAAGIDLLWFGIFIVLVVEMAQITPPVGFNLFVLQGMTGRDIFYVADASFPFFFMMVLARRADHRCSREIVTWLPDVA